VFPSLFNDTLSIAFVVGLSHKVDWQDDWKYFLLGSFKDAFSTVCDI
jgi:hypothetical protein